MSYQSDASQSLDPFSLPSKSKPLQSQTYKTQNRQRNWADSATDLSFLDARSVNNGLIS